MRLGFSRTLSRVIGSSILIILGRISLPMTLRLAPPTEAGSTYRSTLKDEGHIDHFCRLTHISADRGVVCVCASELIIPKSF